MPLHVATENNRELPPWLQFPNKSSDRSSALTQYSSGLELFGRNLNVFTAWPGTLEQLVLPVGAEPLATSSQSAPLAGSLRP